MTRRGLLGWLIGALALVTVAPRAAAQSALETLTAMADYLAAAVRLFTGAQARAETVDPKSLTDQDRPAVRGELQALTRALDVLLPRREVFIGDLRGYVQMVETQQFTSTTQLEGAWKAGLSGVTDIVRATEDVLKIVSRPDSKLGLVLADVDRVTLQSALSQRLTLLDRFRNMPPPRDQGEIAQLVIMADRYDKLRQAAFELRVSLQATLGKLGA